MVDSMNKLYITNNFSNELFSTDRNNTSLDSNLFIRLSLTREKLCSIIIISKKQYIIKKINKQIILLLFTPMVDFHSASCAPDGRYINKVLDHILITKTIFL